MSVIGVYCELGHLVGGGRRETCATNSKLRQKRRRMRGEDDFFLNVSEYTIMCLHTATSLWNSLVPPSNHILLDFILSL